MSSERILRNVKEKRKALFHFNSFHLLNIADVKKSSPTTASKSDLSTRFFKSANFRVTIQYSVVHLFVVVLQVSPVLGGFPRIPLAPRCLCRGARYAQAVEGRNKLWFTDPHVLGVHWHYGRFNFPERLHNPNFNLRESHQKQICLHLYPKLGKCQVG